jgi:hypothetical protein
LRNRGRYCVRPSSPRLVQFLADGYLLHKHFDLVNLVCKYFDQNGCKCENDYFESPNLCDIFQNCVQQPFSRDTGVALVHIDIGHNLWIGPKLLSLVLSIVVVQPVCPDWLSLDVSAKILKKMNLNHIKVKVI